MSVSSNASFRSQTEQFESRAKVKFSRNVAGNFLIGKPKDGPSLQKQLFDKQHTSRNRAEGLELQWINRVKDRGCEHFYLDDKTTEFKLRSVANCLAHLLQEPQRQSQVSMEEDEDNPQWCRAGCTTQVGMIQQRDSFVNDRTKVKNVTRIHSILLRLSPIEAQVNDSNWIRGQMLDRSKSLDGARQQVLRLIENLNGYCDSIDLLRCILRSNHITKVIIAFDEIVTKAGTQLNEHKQVTKRGLLSSGTDRSRKMVEFRIVREWLV